MQRPTSQIARKQSPTAGSPRWIARSGLAPLELILALPILLTVLALIIDIGIEVKWKIRTLVVSRQAVWRQRPGRNGAADPQPAGWPTQNTTLRVIPAPPPPLISHDPFAQKAVVRGPVLADPNAQSPQSQLHVDTDLFEISGKVEQGKATVDRRFPLLPKFPGVHLNVDHVLADGQWRFQEMNIPTNEWRRILRIYSFTPPGNVVELAKQFQQAAVAIMTFPLRSGLAVLDRDDELLEWYGPPPKDFHEYLRTAGCCSDDPRGLCCTCTLNRFLVHDSLVDDLTQRIQGPKGGGAGGIPSKIADAFLQMYRTQLALQKMGIPAGRHSITELEQLIKQLERFKGNLH